MVCSDVTTKAALVCRVAPLAEPITLTVYVPVGVVDDVVMVRSPVCGSHGASIRI